jgi:hypothetical protein
MNVVAADVHGVENPVADLAVLADRLLDGGALCRGQADLGFNHHVAGLLFECRVRRLNPRTPDLIQPRASPGSQVP